MILSTEFWQRYGVGIIMSSIYLGVALVICLCNNRATKKAQESISNQLANITRAREREVRKNAVIDELCNSNLVRPDYKILPRSEWTYAEYIEHDWELRRFRSSVRRPKKRIKKSRFNYF